MFPSSRKRQLSAITTITNNEDKYGNSPRKSTRTTTTSTSTKTIQKRTYTTPSMTRNTLQTALEANRRLQQQIYKEIERIAYCKEQNRYQAVKYIRTMTNQQQQTKQQITHKEVLVNSEPTTIEKQNSKSDIDMTAVPSSKELHALFSICTDNKHDNGNAVSTKSSLSSSSSPSTAKPVTSTTTPKPPTKWTVHKRRQFRYDPYRKWILEYFVDPIGAGKTTPRPNHDMNIRRQRQQQLHHSSLQQQINNYNNNDVQSITCTTTNTNSSDQDRFYYHLQPPFTKRERSYMDKAFLTYEDGTIDTCSNDNDENKDIYERIAIQMQHDSHNIPLPTTNTATNSISITNMINTTSTISSTQTSHTINDKAMLPTSLPRTTREIQLYHQHTLASRHKYTKQESLAILKHISVSKSAAGAVVREQGQQQQQQQHFLQTKNSRGIQDIHNDNNENQNSDSFTQPDWQKIARSLNEQLERTDQSLNNENHNNKYKHDHNKVNPMSSITPYQCMVYYKTKLSPRTNVATFTPEEDELLLRYIACMGPQFVWDGPQISHLSCRLFPNKEMKRIYERTQFSLWSPLVKDTYWTMEEEKRLVLAMKIYSTMNEQTITSDRDATASIKNGTITHTQNFDTIMDSLSTASANNNNNNNNVEKPAIRKAAMHFYPDRQADKVMKKWERSLNPNLSYGPFTDLEDTKLLDIVKTTTVEKPFAEIAREYFPNRSRDQIYQRWIEIASTEDVINKYGPTLVQRGVKKGLMMSTNKNNTVILDNDRKEENGNHKKKSTDQGLLFKPDDFVVRFISSGSKKGRNKK